LGQPRLTKAKVLGLPLFWLISIGVFADVLFVGQE
jgi:hypothetical protein